MATKPSVAPRWAQTAAGVVVTGANAPVAPNSGKLDVGFAPGEKPAANFVNWLFNTIHLWVLYLQDAIFTATPGSGFDGVRGTGDGAGYGVRGTGGATNGVGVAGIGIGSSQGVLGQGGASAGSGVTGLGGAASGAGVAGTGGATNGVGVTGQGTGTGAGVSGTGGNTGGASGVQGTGGTGGHGVSGTGGPGNTNGFLGQGTGSGAGAYLTGGATNGIGVNCFGVGTGPGVLGTGGASGAGVAAIAGGGGAPVRGALNMTPQVAPSAPVDGDTWTTTAGLFARVSGVTQLISPKAWASFNGGSSGTANFLQGNGFTGPYTTSTNTLALTFAQAATSASYAVIVTAYYNNGSTPLVCAVTSQSTTGFTLSVYNSSTGAAVNVVGGTLQISVLVLGV